MCRITSVSLKDLGISGKGGEGRTALGIGRLLLLSQNPVIVLAEQTLPVAGEGGSSQPCAGVNVG